MEDIQPVVVVVGTRKVVRVEPVQLVVDTAVLVVGMLAVGIVEVDVTMVSDWVKHHLMVEGR